MNTVGDTGSDGFHRVANRAVFSGTVSPERYLVIDDFVGQGGTLAKLIGHAHLQGGTVVGALEFHFEDGRVVSMPSAPKRGRQTVTLPASVSAKALLFREPLIKSIPKILRRYWGICGVALLVR